MLKNIVKIIWDDLKVRIDLTWFTISFFLWAYLALCFSPLISEMANIWVQIEGIFINVYHNNVYHIVHIDMHVHACFRAINFIVSGGVAYSKINQFRFHHCSP